MTDNELQKLLEALKDSPEEMPPHLEERILETIRLEALYMASPAGEGD